MLNKDELRKSVADILHVSAEEVDFNKDFREIGIDSLNLFLLIDKFEEKYDICINLENVYDLKNLNEFYNMLCKDEG